MTAPRHATGVGRRAGVGSAAAALAVAAAGLAAGACGASSERCEAPLAECAGSCVDTASDPAHCGGCGAACSGGQVCAASLCMSSGCADRTGGAFVTFTICASPASAGSSFTAWATREAFVAEAERLLATGDLSVPLFDLADGGDCDAQWTFHADPATPDFSPFAIEVCDACPEYVEAHKADFIALGWCPWTARVAAVSRR